MAAGTSSTGWRGRIDRLRDRRAARRAAREGRATGFVSAPEPRSIGRYARGRQLIAGNVLLSGQLFELGQGSIWELEGEISPAVEEERHGCTWLDDLAAVGDGRARARAQDWVFGWIDRFGQGTGPGWSADLTGRRLIRWINHSFMLLRGREGDEGARFFNSLAAQTLYLSRRFPRARPGLPRFEALTGLIYGALSLEGLSHLATPAITALGEQCASQIDAGGGLPSRNPEELMEVLTLLTWALEAVTEAERTAPPQILAATTRIAPTLRALRHNDGLLARFHGGGRGLEGRLDQALAMAGVKARREARDLAMGFARLAGGRTSIIVDADLPPKGTAAATAHASTLAMELTSGRRQVVVNCGSGVSFGPDWRRAGRATASHSTLGLDGVSSSRMAVGKGRSGPAMLSDGPTEVPVQWESLSDGTRLQAGHNGWKRSHGLTHARSLDLSFDGRALNGEDLLTTLDDADQYRFDRAMDAAALQGIAFSIRFHLHPDVEAERNLGGKAVSLTLKSGETWVLQHDGSVRMDLERSVYLENGRLRPRAAQQVVLSGRAMSYATRVRWSLTKAHETPLALRDFGPDHEGEDEDGW